MQLFQQYWVNILYCLNMIRSLGIILVTTGLVICFQFTVEAATKNGFNLSSLRIDKEEILAGGPPRDGIPSIDQPKFIAVNEVNYLRDDDIVIGLVRGNIARAYPTRILVWHEIVNETIANEPVVVTYCPLCGTAMVFARKVAGKTLSFGVSGLLYRSDVLMYDRESESLWSQLQMEAVSGEASGNKLTWLPSSHSTWQAWREKYPQGEVLSTDTGYQRNYSAQAYASYFASPNNMFPVPHTRTEISKKSWVIGIIVDGQAKAYPVKAFKTNSKVTDKAGANEIFVRYDEKTRQPSVTTSSGEIIPSVMVFWFAWQAFYPDTQLWQG